MKRLFSTITLLLAAAFAALAQITVQAPTVVAADEQFNVVFTVEGEKPSEFDWQCPPAFKLVWGPQKGSSTSVSIINGKRTSSTQTSFTYILMPTKEGTFTLPGATAKIKGKDVTSKQFTIQVAKSGAATSSSNPNQQNAYSVAGEDLFLRLDVSRRNVVVGEPLTASIKLYQRVNIAGFEDVKFPSFDGFWNQVTVSPSTVEFHRESLGDEIYDVATLRGYTLIPQQSGDIVIDPAEVVCLIRVRNRNSSTGSLFDSFFQDDYSTIRKRVSTKSTTIHVSPLPQPQPASFCGGVGKFSIKAMAAKDSLATHDASSILVTVTGKGNLELIQAPKVKFPPDFEAYDVKVTDKDGAKLFEYPFIPRHYGDFDIPPVEFSYYDLNAGNYVTVSSDSLHVKVSRSEGDAQPSGGASQSFVGVAGRDVRNLGTDIRYIATGDPDLSRAGAFFVMSTPFMAILAVLILGAFALWLSLRKAAERRADVVGARKRTASKMARKRLAQAGAYLKDNLYSAFYEELHKALLGFVADKFNIDSAEQDKETISEKLLASGAAESDVKEFIDLLDACEFARYAPDSGHDAMDAHYKSALEVVSALDDSMKKRHNMAGASALLAIAMLGAPSFFGGIDASAAAPSDSLWTAGVQAYADSRWDDALSDWLTIVEQGQESAKLYTNIGSAYFKQGDIAYAILYYEKALKVDPSYADAKYDLQFAQTFLKDKIESVPEFFVVTWLRSLRNALGSNVWAIAFLVLLALALAMTLLFLLGRSQALRKTGFFTGLVALLLGLICLGFSLKLRADYSAETSAIVVSPVSVVRSAPDNNSGTDLFILHEGTKVNLLDSVGNWSNIELADGRQGWIMVNEIEII